MPTTRHRTAREATDHGTSLRVLDHEGYERIRTKPRTFEIHSASALFPKRKITADAVVRMVLRKIHGSSSYNAVFHLRDDAANEVAVQLKRAWRKMPNPSGRWFVMPHHVDREAAQARARNAAPHGQN